MTDSRDGSASLHTRLSVSASASTSSLRSSPSHETLTVGMASLQVQPSPLNTPGPHPLPAYLKAIGAHVATLAARESSAAPPSKSSGPAPPSPLLCAFVARALMLEAEEAAALTRGLESSPYPLIPPASQSGGAGAVYSINLTPGAQDRLVQSSLQRLRQMDDPLLETLKMQVAFESAYAAGVAQRRADTYAEDQRNSAMLQGIMAAGSNISSNAQVAALYRAIFKLMRANGGVDQPAAASTSSPASPPAAAAAPSPTDRSIDREIAAALESVFPQSGLNAFNMLSSAEKRTQVLSLINIVLGIRLFNREIAKGGAGIRDVPGEARREVEALYETCERESTTMGDLCHSYSDVLQLELRVPGSISASLARLQAELTHRRQYSLLVHQVSQEVLESMDRLDGLRARFAEVVAELKELVGLRSSVPKEQVYPLFSQLALHWRSMGEERALNKLRESVVHAVLLNRCRNPFQSNLMEEDLLLVARAKKEKEKNGEQGEEEGMTEEQYAEFVETVGPTDANDAGTGGGDGNGAAAEEEAQQSSVSYRPVRLIPSHTPNFMSLPLEFQGYCPHALVHRGGLLLAGNPGLGIIRLLGRHYAFSSVQGMRDFVAQPEKYVEGALSQARKTPALIHLLALQQYIPHSDLHELFNLDSLASSASPYAASGGLGPQKCSTGSQTPFRVNTDLPDRNYHWNEWELRRQALQLAEITQRKTTSAQTDLSHFRRDNDSQTSLPGRDRDGVAEGVGTQTGVEKSSQVERVYRYQAGLRGDSDTAGSQARARMVELRVPAHVEEATNSDLTVMAKGILKDKDGKTSIVREKEKA